MPRLLFEKTGSAVWISHLDLMRLFQRAFKRAGLPLKHTQGFNPRPFVSIALPLSVGIESSCELLDFELDGAEVSLSEIKNKLNYALVDGVKVLDVYENADKLKNLAFLDCTLCMEYDNGIPEQAVEEMKKLFSSTSVVVEKKNKNGISEQDIIPMIRKLEILEKDRTVCYSAIVCCQNPSLNPMQMHAAVLKYLPQYAPDHVTCKRNEVFDLSMNVYR